MNVHFTKFCKLGGAVSIYYADVLIGRTMGLVSSSISMSHMSS